MSTRNVCVAIVATLSFIGGRSDAQTVTLEPNQIRGVVGFTNTNPTIVSIMQSNGLDLCAVEAVSENPTDAYRSNTGFVTNPAPMSCAYELTTESNGGQGSVTYRMNATGWTYRRAGPPLAVGNGQYYFRPIPGVVLQPPGVMPNGATLNLQECVGLIRFNWGYDGDCANRPAPVTGGYTFTNYGFTYFGNASTHYLFWPGDVYGAGPPQESITVYYTSGSDPLVDQVSYVTSVNVGPGCDQIQDICIPIPTGGGGALGGFTGPFDVVGQDELVSSNFFAWHGPANNARGVKTYVPGLRPVGDPSQWWTLPNLPPGDYDLSAWTYLQTGRLFSRAGVTQISLGNDGPATSQAGVTSDLRLNVGGQLRYPYVMNPAYFEGTMRLADPYVPANPGSYSTLSAIRFREDTDGDGIPQDPWASGEPYTELLAQALGSANGYIPVQSQFPGTFNNATGELLSQYRMPLLNAYDLPHDWDMTRVSLFFWSQGATSAYYLPPGNYDPRTYRHGGLNISLPVSARRARLGGGQTARVDHEYCFGELQILYNTTSGTLYNPVAFVNGGFSGTDWRGRQAEYTVDGFFYGTPAAGYYVNGASAARASGQVTGALPAGDYSLLPQVAAVSPSGQTSQATLTRTQVRVGCGQRISAVPGLSVQLDTSGRCTSSSSADISIRVDSGAARVDRVWYRLNGGLEIELCAGCAPSPSFTFTIPLNACANTIEAFASGVPGTASASDTVTLDDPNDGVVCGGGVCTPDCSSCGNNCPADCAPPNNPPAALCRNVTLDAAAGTCGAAASIDAGSSDPDGGAVSVTQSPAGPYPIGTTSVTLTVTDASGLSAQCTGTVTVVDRDPPSIACPAPARRECEGQQGCVDLGSATASDACGGAVVFGPGPACYPLGTTSLTYGARDESGNTAYCTTSVTVVDTAGPSVTAAGAGQLWSPNHKYERIGLESCGIRIADACGGSSAYTSATSAAITCVTSDEVEDAIGQGDGNTLNDIVIVDSRTVMVRSERMGGQDGRVYRIGFTITDAAGNTSPGTCVVGVPHDQRPGAVPIDSGVKYTVCR